MHSWQTVHLHCCKLGSSYLERVLDDQGFLSYLDCDLSLEQDLIILNTKGSSFREFLTCINSRYLWEPTGRFRVDWIATILFDSHQENSISVTIVLLIESVLDLQYFDNGSKFLVKDLKQLIKAIILLLALINSNSNVIHFRHLKVDKNHRVLLSLLSPSSFAYLIL